MSISRQQIYISISCVGYHCDKSKQYSVTVDTVNIMHVEFTRIQVITVNKTTLKSVSL